MNEYIIRNNPNQDMRGNSNKFKKMNEIFEMDLIENTINTDSNTNTNTDTDSNTNTVTDTAANTKIA